MFSNNSNDSSEYAVGSYGPISLSAGERNDRLIVCLKKFFSTRHF